MLNATQSYGMQMYSQVQRGTPSQPAETTRSSPATPYASEDSSSSASQDTVALSPASKEIAKQQQAPAANQEKGTDQQPLTEEELVKLTELKQRDTEVKAHEQAHLSAAGAYAAGGASFSYTTGPNGKKYATGGEVPIDVSKEDTPAATILKMQTIQRAALAPANPSSTDRAIAAQAGAKELQARKELQAQENTSSEQTDPAQGADTGDKAVTQEPQEAPEVSDYSRKSMTSAYQAVAALAH